MVCRWHKARATVRELPLSTSFCTGSGKHFYQSGAPAQGPWFNLSLQDAQPLWLPVAPSSTEASSPKIASALDTLFGWAPGSPGKLNLVRDDSTVYNGGCSLCCQGSMRPGSLGVVQLYACDALAPSKIHVSYVYKTNSATAAALAVVLKGREGHECHVMAPTDEESWQQIICCDDFPCNHANLSFVEQEGPLDAEGKVRSTCLNFAFTYSVPFSAQPWGQACHDALQ